mmetsp:Transcript_11613/g.32977  ORF Transcript_11613/g.32977 Transcript_11613/m.32977 type:complete len:245 (-) Transcript_11613:279-1013(-)
MTSEYHMGKFSVFFHCSARRVSPFWTFFLLVVSLTLGTPSAFLSFLSFLGILGLAFLPPPPAVSLSAVLGREAGGLPAHCSLPSPSPPPPPSSFWGKSTTTGSTPIRPKYSINCSGVSTVLASFLIGWEWTASALVRFSSRTRVMSFAAAVLIRSASGPTQPLAQPNFSRRRSSDASRKLTLPSNFSRSLPRTLVLISALGVVVTRYKPCFLSLKRRFLVCVWVDEGRGTVATNSSAVMHSGWP